MKTVLYLLCVCHFLFAQKIADIDFNQSWQLDNGVAIINTTLELEGDDSQYRKAQLTVPVLPTTTNIYFVADIFLSGIVEGDNSYKAPKLKVYDSNGNTIKAFNMLPLIENDWYTTGMVLENFHKMNLSSIVIEFSIQNIEGTMRVRNPQLLDAPPVSTYSFPFSVPADNSCFIAIETDKKRPFNNELLSVNSHFVWAGSSWKNSDVKELFASRLQLGNLRFPGGTVGNFYDWESDGFYGDEWTFLSPSRKKAYEEGFRFDFDGFADNCKATDASATLMFNVIKDSPQKAADRLRDRINKGLDIAWVEMGNENFFTEQAFGNVATTDKYIQHTKSLATALKSVAPSVKVGVNINHHDFSVGSWNKKLAAEDYFDVAIMHPYVQTNSFLLNKYSSKIMLSAYKTTLHRFTEYEECFGTQRPLILTEWGILSEGTSPNWIQALSVADMFLSILEGADKGIVKQAGIHMLYHSDNYSEATLYYKEGGIFKRTRLGVLYERISTLFNGKEVFSALGKSSLLEEGLQAQNLRAIDYGDSIKILAVNKTPKESELAITIDDGVYTGPFVVESFVEQDIVSSTGYSISENPWKKSVGSGVITLEANSISVITIEKSQSTIINNVNYSVNTIRFKKLPGSVLVTTPELSTVALLSLQGKMLEKYQNRSVVQLGAGVSEGLYLLSITNSNGVFTQKIYIP